MNSNWQDHLINAGAVYENQQVIHYGHPEQERLAAASQTVLCDLSHLGLIAASGEESQAFLQGQLTNDLRKINPGQAQYNSYCSPKGRMLANFMLWQSDGDYFMQLSPDLQESIQKRLSMFVMRSKVKLRDARGEWVRLGIAGPDAEALVQEIVGTLPQGAMAATRSDQASAIRLQQNRFELIVALEHAPALWDSLRSRSTPVGVQVWQWLEIESGIPTLTTATQEHFVPQMVNFEAIGGVSFQKGCYPGQEIVARTQYLGKLKRRMYLAHLSADTTPSAGDELFSSDMEEQSSGMIVNAEASPEGGYDLLAVIQMSSVEAGAIHWKSLDGPQLQLRPLPYTV
jgi:hypothetical protein